MPGSHETNLLELKCKFILKLPGTCWGLSTEKENTHVSTYRASTAHWILLNDQCDNTSQHQAHEASESGKLLSTGILKATNREKKKKKVLKYY